MLDHPAPQLRMVLPDSRTHPTTFHIECFRGEVDIVASPALATTLDRLLSSPAPTVLDLTRVGFLGTSALSLLAGFTSDRRAAGLMSAIAADPRLHRPLSLGGLNPRTAVVTETVDAAIDALVGSPS